MFLVNSSYKQATSLLFERIIDHVYIFASSSWTSFDFRYHQRGDRFGEDRFERKRFKSCQPIEVPSVCDAIRVPRNCYA